MADVNNVTLTGTLGRDPESKMVGDKKLVKFSIAVNGYGDKVDWINIEVWGKPAEYVENYLNKGSKVAIVGRIKVDSWSDRDGNKRTGTSVVANQVQGIGKKSEQSESSASKNISNDADDAPF